MKVVAQCLRVTKRPGVHGRPDRWYVRFTFPDLSRVAAGVMDLEVMDQPTVQPGKCYELALKEVVG